MRNLIIGLFIALGGVSLFAEEQLPISQGIIREKLSEFLSSAPLFPYIPPGPAQFEIHGLLDEVDLLRNKR